MVLSTPAADHEVQAEEMYAEALEHLHKAENPGDTIHVELSRSALLEAHNFTFFAEGSCRVLSGLNQLWVANGTLDRRMDAWLLFHHTCGHCGRDSMEMRFVADAYSKADYKGPFAFP